MQLSEMEMLVVLANEMNMRKAAERLFVSQPALSQRLQSIEKSWGCQIFLRSQKGLTLTPAGERIVLYARNMIEQEAKLREELQFIDKEIYGTLRLAVASIIGQNWLPKILKTYVQAYPHARVSLLTGWSSEMVQSVYDDTVHLGIIRGQTDWKGFKEHILTDKLYLVDTEITNFNDVLKTERPFIQFKSDSSYYQEIQNWWHRQFQTAPKRTIVVDQIETCKQMTFHGIGYAILPSVILDESDIQINKIPLLDEYGMPMCRDTWVIGYESTMQLKQVQAFIDIVRAASTNE
ncbi:LysR family transcriptional regulator [Bacillus sp. HMF5848]|uniref:LysR family transcriptional regulator n=1 Tax=Bacillus sp. HMF5848 TaxID=2495421 RepID=UPI000F7A1D83|nr:LysR family transcriptional regulator [Bacillus sp. HMF5848]RSK26851.1 LysR family transcriptional regulator [Bacillus sp. HMF5848]